LPAVTAPFAINYRKPRDPITAQALIIQTSRRASAAGLSRRQSFGQTVNIQLARID
jgi:hypothetical protein